tara:strand:- start:3927 stop:4226 length:300 start_codon:yes stop_codon:yes gene_type:complete
MATAAQEIALMQQRMDSFEDKLDSMDGKLDKLTLSLLDPDNGFVSRVNKNTDFRETKLMKYDILINEFQDMKRWKLNVTRALWIIFTAGFGLLLKTFLV